MKPENFEQEHHNFPRMMTIREIARTGILPEHAVRRMVKDGAAPFIMCGNRPMINYDKLVQMLEEC